MKKSFRIACIAWGSLLWKSEPMKLLSNWKPGGPLLPLEFARNSDDSPELALVICKNSPFTNSFWNEFATDDVDKAIEELKIREKIHADNLTGVSLVTKNSKEPDIYNIRLWLKKFQMDAAIFTSLKPKFKGQEGRIPTLEEAQIFLLGLPTEKAKAAAEYLERVPASICTPYRSVLIKTLNQRDFT